MVMIDWFKKYIVPMVSIWVFVRSSYCYYNTFEPIYLLRACISVFIGYALVNQLKAKYVDESFYTSLIVVLHLILPYLLQPSRPDVKIPYLSLVILGAVVSGLGILDIGNSFGVLPARRKLKVRGIYKLVRHPIYFGYILSMLGWCFFSNNIANFFVWANFVGLTILRIGKEEENLSNNYFYYKKYKSIVRSKLIPGLL